MCRPRGSLLSVLAVRDDERLDAAVELAREHVVALGDVLERDAVGDDVARLEVRRSGRARTAAATAASPGTGWCGCVSPLFIASPNLTALKSGPNAPTTDTLPPLRTESMAQLSATGEPPCSFSLAAVTCWKKLPSASAPTASMTHVRAEEVRRLLEPMHDVVDLREVDRLGMGEPARELEAVVDVVDDDDAARAHQPGRLRGEQPDRPGAEHDTTSPSRDLADLRAE